MLTWLWGRQQYVALFQIPVNYPIPAWFGLKGFGFNGPITTIAQKSDNAMKNMPHKRLGKSKAEHVSIEFVHITLGRPNTDVWCTTSAALLDLPIRRLQNTFENYPR